MKLTGRAFSVCGVLLLTAAPARAEPRIRGELAIESKLMAPCCWVQTLDAHESPLATQLRQEIRTRLTRGVPAEQIASALVTRYGERLRAIPLHHDPRTLLMNVGFSGMGLTLAGLVLFAWRWRKRALRVPFAADVDESQRVQLDARLDAELRHFDP